MKETVLEIKNLSVIIKERYLVKNVSLSLFEGEAVALVGQDKSGKTSLIKAITHSLPISEGEVFVCGRNITDNNAMANIAIALDPPVFFKFQTVYNNISYLTKFIGNVSKNDILEALKLVGLENRKKTLVLFLTYTEKKLLSLAIAFLTKPKILLLDEPFKSLSDDMINNIKSHIRELQKCGTAVIISSTNIDNVRDICSRFVFMEDRQVKQILDNKDCDEFLGEKEWAFVQVKYPHFIGKTLIDTFGLRVKLLGNKVLFDANSELLAKIVKYLSVNKIAIFKAGFLNNQAENVMANLTPYFKEEEE